jgi:predicted Fe-Mo cluster-binding NifX family protein
MKIAVPIHNGNVNDHFGHSEHYAVYTISPEKMILKQDIINTDQGCGCKSGIAVQLAHMGVTMMMAGNIGGGAIHHLNNYGITVVRGCQGPAEEVVQNFLKGDIIDNGQTCGQHQGCDHHHN